MMMPERPKNSVLIVVKSPTLCEHVYTKPDQSIFGLRALIGAKFEMKLDFIILVFAGKILIDEGTLDQHNIDEGSTVYLVEKKTIQENGYGTMLSSQRNVASPMLTRVSFVKTLINTLWPQMESMVNEPDLLREILFNDARMKHIMERHPSIRYHINNDAYIREMIQCLLCPARLEELNRKRDLMLLRVESTPGGTAILHSINNTLSESLENAAPLSRIRSSKKPRKSNNQRGKENRMPLPNPWTRPRKTRKQVPRFLRRLTRLNRILPIQIQVKESKSTQTDQKEEEEPIASNSPKRLVPVVLGILNVENPQSTKNPIIGKFVGCVANGIARLAKVVQKKSAESVNVDNKDGVDESITNESNMIATDLKGLLNTLVAIEEKDKRLVAEYWQSVDKAKKSVDQMGSATYTEISTGYEETTKVTKPNGESVFVTKRTQGTNTEMPLVPSSLEIIPFPKPLTNDMTSLPIQPQLQNIGQDAAAATGAHGNGDDNAEANAEANADTEKDELPPEIRYRDQLDHLASLGFNNRNENLVALMESLGDVNAAAELLLEIKKEKL